MNYPEIDQLHLLQKQKELSISFVHEIKKGLLEVVFKSGTKSWNLFIDDEYGDFKEENQLLCIFLVLKSLEDYAETEDYLEWCKISYLEPGESRWLDYYRNLSKIHNEIEKVLGSIHPIISSFDYELRAGAYSALRGNR